jgi:hypothetical protein
MSGSNGQCCTSDQEQAPIIPKELIEEDGFITIVATGLTRPGAAVADPEQDPKPPAPSDPA